MAFQETGSPVALQCSVPRAVLVLIFWIPDVILACVSYIHFQLHCLLTMFWLSFLDDRSCSLQEKIISAAQVQELVADSFICFIAVTSMKTCRDGNTGTHWDLY